MNDDLQEHVDGVAERIKNDPEACAWHPANDERGSPLDVNATVSLHGTIKDVTLVVATGGPHIEVNLSRGTVVGYWGNDEYTTPFRESDATKAAERYYRDAFNMQVLD